jgi:acyl-CoA thioester hydrolase
MAAPTAGEFRDGAHWLPIRVYYEDTDFTGVVYHANFLRYMERGRSDFIRLAGVDHGFMAAQGGAAFAVAKIDIDYKKPARIDDALVVRSQFAAIKGVRLHALQQKAMIERLAPWLT